MATITPLTIQSSAGGHGTGTYDTGAFTTLDNSICAIFVAGVDQVGGGGIEALVSITSTPALTWTKQVFQDGSNWGYGGGWYTAPVTTGASTVVHVANGTGRSMQQWHVKPFCIQGYDTGTPIGAIAEGIAGGVDGAQSVTLNATPAASSYVLAALYRLMSTGRVTADPGSGWTETDDDVGTTDYDSLEIEYRTGLTSTTVPWADIDTGTGSVDQAILVALEIKSAATGYSLTCAQGSYALTGQAVNLLKGSGTACAQGSYALTGQDATLTKVGGQALVCAQGSYTVLGSTALVDIEMDLEQGSYALTGQDVGLLASILMALQQGAYALTGRAVSLLYSGAPAVAVWRKWLPLKIARHLPWLKGYNTLVADAIAEANGSAVWARRGRVATWIYYVDVHSVPSYPRTGFTNP